MSMRHVTNLNIDIIVDELCSDIFTITHVIIDLGVVLPVSFWWVCVQSGRGGVCYTCCRHKPNWFTLNEKNIRGKK